jgi:LytR cell envelope-related transcriptional attenuator
MRTIPFALSIHHFISSVGADAGFASLIGLAILVLLYFAQARETANLRGRADEAAERVHELEGQFVALSDQLSTAPAEISVHARSQRTPVTHRVAADAPARAPAAAGVSARAMPPAAPAGVGAPALAAATRLIPDPSAAVAPPEFASAGASGAAAGNGADVGAPPPATVAGAANGSPRQPAVAASAATAQRPVGAPPMGAAGVGAPPATGGARPSPGPVRSPAAPGRGGGQPSPPGPGRVPGGSPRPGPGGVGGGGGAPILPPMDRPARRRSRATRVLAILIGCLLVAGAVAGLLIVTGGGSSTASKSAASHTSTVHRPVRATGFEPSGVTVAVLNGTDINGLAARISQRLATEGYRKGRVTNAASQSTTSTMVQYMLPTDRTDALHVASALKLRPSSLGLIDPNTKLLVCQSSTPCTAAVVVTVGSDLASQ